MPGYDGKGPMGKGSMTGGGFGYCRREEDGTEMGRQASQGGRGRRRRGGRNGIRGRRRGAGFNAPVLESQEKK